MQEFYSTARITFGAGSLQSLKRIRNKKVLIVTDGFMASIDAPEKVASRLEGCSVSVFDGVVPDPPIEVVTAGVEVLRAHEAEVMIALGGGSTIDAAKAIRSIGSVVLQRPAASIELVAIPTTSGTGSEVTNYAVISDQDKGLKYPLDNADLCPSWAILDPELTVSVPPSITADTGMDVLTHALEAYVSLGASDFTDALAEKATAFVFEFLPIAFKDGSNLQAREKMHNASCMAGMAFNAAGLGVNHGLAHTLGAKFHIPHGRANALMLPHVIRFNADMDGARDGQNARAAKKYCHMAKLLGMGGAAAPWGANSLIRAVERLSRELHIPATLKECGCDMADVKRQMKALPAIVVADMTTSTNPRPVSEAQAAALLEKVAR